MIRNYTFIAITLIAILTLISGGYLVAQQTSKAKFDYDAGIAAYQRGHYRVALSDFEKRATRGDTVAQFCLAFMYKHGYGINKPNPEGALEWYKKSAEQGYPPAQNNLGVLYMQRAQSTKEEFESLIEAANTGKGGPPKEITEYLEDRRKKFQLKNNEYLENAKKWFQSGAEKGYAPAQFNLYLTIGLGNRAYVQDNRVEWLTKAAEQNYPPAQNALGSLYLNGDHGNGIATDLQKAVEWFQKSSNQSYAAAQWRMGLCYELGKGVQQNYGAAFYWYDKAAIQGFAKGQYYLGLCYYEGKGVTKDPKKAFTWFFRAATKGSIQAQNTLAVIYSERNNEGDLEMANRWYHRAAQRGEPIAQRNIGRHFEKGLGRMPQDDAEAYFWYSLALKNKTSLDQANIKDLAAKTVEAHERVRKSLDPGEISEIDKRIKNWEPKQSSGAGTGFYIDKHYILTNAHVVINPKTNRPWNEFRIPYQRVELINWDSAIDLALLYDKRGNTSTAILRGKNAKLGEKVTVFGYPRSSELSYEGNITQGNVSGTFYVVDQPQFANRFQHTSPTQRGNSGGPIFDRAGNVVGVSVSLIHDPVKIMTNEPSIGNRIPQSVNIAQNINFAIKSTVVTDFLSKNGISFVISSKKPITDIPLEEIVDEAENFTVPVLCFKNRGYILLEVVKEIRIENLWQ